MRGSPSRRARLASAIRTETSELLRSVKDHRLQAVPLVTVNQVELNADLSVATVYLAFNGADDGVVSEAEAALPSVGRHLRGPLGRRLGLAKCPDLRLVRDGSPEFHERLAGIVAEDSARRVAPDDSDES